MASILWGAKSGFSELFMTETWAGVAEFIGQLLGRGTELTPAFLDFVSWRDALWLSLDTIGMSVLAIGDNPNATTNNYAQTNSSSARAPAQTWLPPLWRFAASPL